MRIGLVARADRTGLGIQTWTFWRNMQPIDATLVVDLHHCSGQHPDLSMYPTGDVEVWADKSYPSIRPTPHPVVERFLQKIGPGGVVFGCETFYNYWLIQRARELGIRTVLQPNYEFLDFILYDGLPEPDVFAFPSTWHLADVKAKLPGRDIRHLPVPVDTELLPFRHRTQLRSILHTAGTPAMEDRNGTLVLIEAMRHVKTPVTCVIRSQKPLPRSVPANVTVDRSPAPNYWDLYDRGDMFVMPRKFGGLCLPQQEALAVGMPVLMTDIAPQNNTFPPELLVAAPMVKEVMTRAMIGIHEPDPVDVAARIDWLYEHPAEFAELSAWAGEWAAAHSWEALRPLYEATLTGVWAQ